MNGSSLHSAGRRRLLAGSAGALATLGLANAPRRAQAESAAAPAAAGTAPASSTPSTATPAPPATRPLPAYMAWKNADALIVHSSTP